MGINQSVKNNLTHSRIFFILSFSVLVIGVVFGSVYLAHTAAVNGGIHEYLENFISSAAETDRFLIFKNAFRSNLISLAVIFAAGFFKFGIALTAASVIRRGFIMGFTTASFIKYYGAKGFLAMSATMPSALIMLAALLFFAAVSAGFSLSANKRSLAGIYVFSALFTLAVFAAAALCEGYLTTSFMGAIFGKI